MESTALAHMLDASMPPNHNETLVPASCAECGGANESLSGNHNEIVGVPELTAQDGPTGSLGANHSEIEILNHNEILVVS